MAEDSQVKSEEAPAPAPKKEAEPAPKAPAPKPKAESSSSTGNWSELGFASEARYKIFQRKFK